LWRRGTVEASDDHIYRDMREIVAPRHTAIVVWDVQNALVNRVFNQDEFLVNLKGFIGSARHFGVPLIYSRITPLPPQYESPFRTYMFMRRLGVDDPGKLPQFMLPGTPEAEIHPEVSPTFGDTVLNKHTASIFVGTHFETMMRNRGVNTILFTGIATEIGIDSSARDSANRGFYTAVVEDCVSSPDKEMHESALKTLRSVCLVVRSADVVKQWP
jgi:nicotinamidase-related amidase